MIVEHFADFFGVLRREPGEFNAFESKLRDFRESGGWIFTHVAADSVELERDRNLVPP